MASDIIIPNSIAAIDYAKDYKDMRLYIAKLTERLNVLEAKVNELDIKLYQMRTDLNV